MPWGEPHPRATGTTGEIEIAHEAMDALRVPPGSLADRVLVLVARHRALAELSLPHLAAAYEVAQNGCAVDRAVVRQTLSNNSEVSP